MDLSETIVAAMIGAAATVVTAMFQLFLAFRSNKAEVRPRKGSGVRSMLAVFLIVVGAAVAGFAYSELRAERARESTLALQEKLTMQVEAVAATARRMELLRGASADSAVLTGRPGTPGRSEAMMQVAACRPQTAASGTGATGCDAAHANRVALCASVPARASVLDVLLYARPVSVTRDWEDDRVAIEEEVEGAGFVEQTWEQEQSDGSRAVCARFAQWNSEQSHAARIVVLYAPQMPARSIGTSDEALVTGQPSPVDSTETPVDAAAEQQAASMTVEPARPAKQAAAISPQ